LLAGESTHIGITELSSITVFFCQTLKTVAMEYWVEWGTMIHVCSSFWLQHGQVRIICSDLIVFVLSGVFSQLEQVFLAVVWRPPGLEPKILSASFSVKLWLSMALLWLLLSLITLG